MVKERKYFMRLLFVLIMLSGLYSCNSSKVESKGDYYRIQKVTKSISGGTEIRSSSEYSYDDNGNLEQIKNYSFDGSLFSIDKYFYDDHNYLSLIEKTVEGEQLPYSTEKYNYIFSADETTLWITNGERDDLAGLGEVFKYDNNKRVISYAVKDEFTLENIYENNLLQSTYIEHLPTNYIFQDKLINYSYNPNGKILSKNVDFLSVAGVNCLTESQYNSDNYDYTLPRCGEDVTYSYIYDSELRLKSVVTDEGLQLELFQYDSNGQLITHYLEGYFDVSGENIYRKKLEYENGNIIFRYEYNNGTGVYETVDEYQYDENDLLVRSISGINYPDFTIITNYQYIESKTPIKDGIYSVLRGNTEKFFDDIYENIGF